MMILSFQTRDKSRKDKSNTGRGMKYILQFVLEAPLDDVDPVAALVQRVLRLGDLRVRGVWSQWGGGKRSILAFSSKYALGRHLTTMLKGRSDKTTEKDRSGPWTLVDFIKIYQNLTLLISRCKEVQVQRSSEDIWSSYTYYSTTSTHCICCFD